MTDNTVFKIILLTCILSLIYSYFQIKKFRKTRYYSSILSTRIDFKLEDLRTMNGREFEVACADIFKYLGYKVKITQATNDEGKDLILDNSIYVECKCWEEDNISRPILQKLVGAMVADNITKGVVITTSYFTDNAKEYMAKINKNKNVNIELKLYDLMDIRDILSNISKEEIKNEIDKRKVKIVQNI